LDNLEYIEAYFNEELSEEGKREFEVRITVEPGFAEDVALYLSMKQATTSELLDERGKFNEIYRLYRQGSPGVGQKPSTIRKVLPWLAAAAAVLAGVIFGWNAWFKPAAPEVLANKYILENFQTLPVTMSSKENSLQTGLQLYNEGRLDQALKQFESMLVNDTAQFQAKKYAGIVSLRLGQYDKAIDYFSQLQNYSQLYVNPGKFYHALALMKRNRPGDKQDSKIFLEQVVRNDLEGNETARKWLKKM
jgi:tetratricopeptide (TPR) repeat protein